MVYVQELFAVYLARETLKRLAAEAIGLPASKTTLTVRPPLTYQSNRLYDLRAGDGHWIVKEFLKPDEVESAPAREYRALERLAPLDIAPRPVCFQPAPRPPLGPFVIYEFMAGEMWDRRRPSDGELAQLARLWLSFNTLPAGDLGPSRLFERSLRELPVEFRNCFQTYADWTETRFPSGRPAAALSLHTLAGCEAIVEELLQLKPVLCFGRTDSRFANIIGRPDGRLGLVDWEDSGLSDPALDIADLLTHANQEDLLSPDEWNAFLEPYLAGRARVDPRLSRRLDLYLLLLPVLWLSILIPVGLQRVEAGRAAGWLVNEMPANRRLRRYLARALAWPNRNLLGQLKNLEGLRFFPPANEF